MHTSDTQFQGFCSAANLDRLLFELRQMGIEFAVCWYPPHGKYRVLASEPFAGEGVFGLNQNTGARILRTINAEPNARVSPGWRRLLDTWDAPQSPRRLLYVAPTAEGESTCRGA
jgi:hypothetical protein